MCLQKKHLDFFGAHYESSISTKVCLEPSDVGLLGCCVQGSRKWPPPGRCGDGRLHWKRLGTLDWKLFFRPNSSHLGRRKNNSNSPQPTNWNQQRQQEPQQQLLSSQMLKHHHHHLLLLLLRNLVYFLDWLPAQQNSQAPQPPQLSQKHFFVSWVPVSLQKGLILHEFFESSEKNWVTAWCDTAVLKNAGDHRKKTHSASRTKLPFYKR